MNIYLHPISLPRSIDYQLSINSHPIEVLATGVADFAPCALSPEDFPACVEITVLCPVAPSEMTVRPLAKQLSATISGHTLTLTLERPEKLAFDFGKGYKALYLYAQPPETNPPAPDTPGLVTFPAGQVTEVPVLTLEDNQTLYLPGGAVLKGRIHVKNKSGIRLCGHGILDGSFYQTDCDDVIPLITLERCPDVLVEDITLVRPAGWMLLLAASDGATVRNLKEIGEVMCSDGIDIVGSSNVLIEDCFLHNNDDCVVVKALQIRNNPPFGVDFDGLQNVQNVLVRRCTFANWTCGNAMEIGHELSVEFVRNVTFCDIDVLHVHGTGAVFSLHNNGCALISNIIFDDIRIEHCYDKFIDFRISKSRYTNDVKRGRICGVTLRNINWNRSQYSLGYTVSLIGGWDAVHTIEDITLENIVINDTLMCNLDDLEIHTRHCHDLRLA